MALVEDIHEFLVEHGCLKGTCLGQYGMSPCRWWHWDGFVPECWGPTEQWRSFVDLVLCNELLDRTEWELRPVATTHGSIPDTSHNLSSTDCGDDETVNATTSYAESPACTGGWVFFELTQNYVPTLPG